MPCTGEKPHPDAPDQTAGKSALADLKREATAMQTLVDPEKAAADARRQARGYKLERLLADLFRIHDLEYRPSYRADGEQIGGSFHFRGFTYLTEVKWRSKPPTAGDLLGFKSKVDGKIDSTRGCLRIDGRL
jgi:hypothetical protein